mgnify:CR=1 FL=1
MPVRLELRSMLERAGLAPADLFRAWDRKRDNSLSKREFLNMVKNLVDNADLWYSTVRPVAEDVYAEACRGVKTKCSPCFQRAFGAGALHTHIVSDLPLAGPSAPHLPRM